MEATKSSTYEIRVRAVQAVLKGLSMSIVAKAYQVNRSTVLRWVERYENEGSNYGLRRRPVSGRPRLFADISYCKLLSIVLKPASNFGYETDFWTCVVVFVMFSAKSLVSNPLSGQSGDGFEMLA